MELHGVVLYVWRMETDSRWTRNMLHGNSRGSCTFACPRLLMVCNSTTNAASLKLTDFESKLSLAENGAAWSRGSSA